VHRSAIASSLAAAGAANITQHERRHMAAQRFKRHLPFGESFSMPPPICWQYESAA
jgi:hypothetical protein